MKQSIRRSQLLETAHAQVVNNGWDATTHRSVAAAVGVNETTVYSHFPKRSELRAALMELAPTLNLPVDAERRMKPGDRQRMLIDTALTLATRDGYKNVTMDALTQAAGVSRTLYARYFTNVDQFRVAVMRAAVKRVVLPVIAQGLAARDPHAMKASAEVRAAAAATLTN